MVVNFGIDGHPQVDHQVNYGCRRIQPFTGCLTKSVEPQSLTRLLLTYDMHAHARENCHLADILQTELLRLFIVAKQLRDRPTRSRCASCPPHSRATWWS